MKSEPDKKIVDKSNSEPIKLKSQPIALKTDNIIQSFQEIDKVIEQLVAGKKDSTPSCK